ncbi:hypothetical protein [Spirochaeta thermophila]|uniref:Ig-like domain-containing protein n=1 Tax=Winmispira thermophila (strain ATCC 49972 / DSM 6192 / RI 19.B1) TaxID=665571 RepID=E0RNE9_WINT6|nr:hypothetical protein [Spirochaeta thermophila]ADN01149.1 hypothetical protein STHERM_c01730 [Spirochaeta thermophila DSM 6192]
MTRHITRWMGLIGILLVMGGCDLLTPGLGPDVDLSPPVLRVVRPDYMENVQSTFTLEGTVKDDSEVRVLVVNLVGSAYQWKHQDGRWRYTQNGREWAPASGTWETQKDGTIRWSVEIVLPPDHTGEIVLEIRCEDAFGNVGSLSIERRTVVVDVIPPKVHLTKPILFVGSYDEAQTKYASYQLEDHTVLSELLNGDVEIRGYQEENAKLSSLEIRLTDHEGTVLWSKVLEDGSMLRNFSLTVPQEELQGIQGKTLIQVVVKSTDAAGNVDERAHGWFCYWPEADIPWVEMPGEAGYPPVETTYPGQRLEGYAYDDDGLGSLQVVVERETGAGWEEVSSLSVRSDEFGGVTSYAWYVNAPQESGIYRIKATVSDINGQAGEERTSYIDVADVNTPRVIVESPPEGELALGDEQGNLVFSGYADDDSGVESVKLVWIHPSHYDESLLSYLNRDYEGWESTGPDGSGNIVFSVSLGNQTYNPGTGRYERPFSRTINLFDDLGISLSLPLSTQTFVFRVEDTNGRASTVKHTLQGDTTPPEVSIDAVIVRHADLQEETYTIDDNLILPPPQDGDEIRFRGSWSDNTTTHWQDASRIGEVELSCNGVPVSTTRNSDATWESDHIPFESVAVLTLEARIRDIGGNEASSVRSVRVETHLPFLVRITSLLPNGYYSVGDEVPIYLEFNKPVSFGGTPPSITLNNSATASYVGGEGSARLEFSYTVASGEDVDDLDVVEVVCEGPVIDESGAEVDFSTLPTGVNSLAGGKDIIIDTTPPEFTQFVVLSHADAYRAGATVVIAAYVSEEVVVNEAPRLALSSGDGAYALYEGNMGDYLRFSYTVAAGENASPLAVEGIDLQSGTISDRAGNPLSTALPDSGALDREVRVDTVPPQAPEIAGISDGATYYGEVSFTVEGVEDGAWVQYSTNGGQTWLTGTGASLTTSGTYTIVARQIDEAGNTSPKSTPVQIRVDNGSLLTRISSQEPDGIYKEGQTLHIVLTFRKPLIVESGTPSLVLNTEPQRTAGYESGSGTTAFVFSYTIQEGDAIANDGVLDVVGIDLTGVEITDESGTDVTQWISLDDLDQENRLSGQRSIRLITTPPEVVSIEISPSGEELWIEFDRAVYRGVGELTITQHEEGLKVPVVLSEREYEIVSQEAPDLAAHYRYMTNGATSSGEPLLDPVYVLEFDKDPDDPALVSSYTAASLHERRIPVESSFVTISGKVVRVSLSGSYALPVRGASYTVSIPSAFMVDTVGHPSLSSERNISLPGVDPPVIRIDRRSETLTERNGRVVAVQPLTVWLKMNSPTPGVEIYYTISEALFDPDPVANPEGNPPTPDPGPSEPADPASASTQYTAPFEIGGAADTLQGYKCWIKARAYKGSEPSEIANEVAFKSVVSFIYDGGRGDAIPDYPGGPLYDRNTNELVVNDSTLPESMWVRGSDDKAGPPTIPGLPLSWNHYDYSGVRLMTQLSSDPQEWYWVTWEVVSTTYIGLLWGTTPSTVEEAARGPWRWGWSKNAFVPFREYYPLFPGESRRIQTSLYATINGQYRGEFIFAREGDGEVFIRDYLRE